MTRTMKYFVGGAGLYHKRGVLHLYPQSSLNLRADLSTVCNVEASVKVLYRFQVENKEGAHTVDEWKAKQAAGEGIFARRRLCKKCVKSAIS